MAINQSIFESFPVLKTERLTLRDIRPQDAKAIYRMRSNARVNQFITRTDMVDETDAKNLVEKTIHAYQNKEAIGWAGLLRDNKEIIGTCGFNRIDYQNQRAEIGGELSVNYWGKKVALETVKTIVEFGFNDMNLHAIEAHVLPDNRGAIFLLRMLGFEKEAHFKDRIWFDNRFYDIAVYTRIK